MASSAVQLAKSELRKEIQSVLSALSSDSIAQQSHSVTQKVLNHKMFVSAKRVGVYASTSGEVCTDEIIQQIFRDGKQCFVPRFKPKAANMQIVQLKSVQCFNAMPSIMWGIRQPPIDDSLPDALDLPETQSNNSDGLDVLLMPGVCFTTVGDRLGHGKGYFDRFLHSHKEKFHSLPYTIGLALKEQMVADLPTTDNDVTLNEIIFSD